MQMELPIDLLRTFKAVFEAGTFTQAGARRHVTQAAVSMQMKRLESLIGRPLFSKYGRQLHLTATGETLLEHAHGILAAHDKAVAAFSNPELFGRVRFGCAEEYSTRFLPAVLPNFRKAFPRIQVDIQVAPGIELAEWLSKDELDLCLLESIPEDGRAGRRKTKTGGSKSPGAQGRVEVGKVVHREPVVWVTSRNATAHEMDPLPLAVYHKGCAYRRWAEARLRSIGRQYWIAFVSPSISSILSAVATGLAVAPIGFGSMTEGLRQLLPEQGFPLLPISEVSLHRSASADNEVVHCFADYVTESFRSVRKGNKDGATRG